MTTRLACLLTVLLSALLLLMLPPDSRLLQSTVLGCNSPATADGIWCREIHLVHNSFAMWPRDPVALVLSVFQAACPNASAGAANLLIFALGFCALACLLTNPTRAMVHALPLAFMCALFYGVDPLVLPGLAYFPWLVWAFFLFMHNRFPSWVGAALLVGLGTLQALAAGTTGFLWYGAAMLCAFCLSDPQRTLPRTFSAAAWLGVLPLLAIVLHVPDLPFPDYPLHAHLVPDDGVPGILRPLVGPSLPLPVIDREALVSAYRVWAVIGLLCSMAGLAGQRSTRPGIRRIWLFSFVMFLSAVLDLMLSESFAQIAPLSALSRLVPYLFYVPLAPMVLALGVTTLWLGSCRDTRPQYLLLCMLLLGLPCWNDSPALRAQAMQRLRDSLIATGDHLNWQSIFNSPSLALLRRLDPLVLRTQLYAKDSKFTRLNAAEVRLTASDSLPQLGWLMDGRGKRHRWSPEKGRQSGNEWLHIRFETPRRLAGLELMTGEYPADFPRGVQVSYAEECTDSFRLEDAGPRYQLLLEYRSWQGEVLFTPSGLPFFGAQAQVPLFFPKAVRAQCVLIQQTAQEQNFDWSVTEIRVLPSRE